MGTRPKNVAEQAAILAKIIAEMRRGASIAAAAESAGIARATVYNWRSKDDAIKQLLDDVNTENVGLVEGSLLRRALGYQYETEEIEVEKDGAGQVLKTKHRKRKHEVEPSVAAIIFYLVRRAPDRWPPPNQIEGQTPEAAAEAVLAFAGALRAKATPPPEPDAEQ